MVSDRSGSTFRVDAPIHFAFGEWAERGRAEGAGKSGQRLRHEAVAVAQGTLDCLFSLKKWILKWLYFEIVFRLVESCFEL